MPSISIHAHTLHELGLQSLQQAIQTNKWPVQITFFSRFRKTTQLFAIFSTCHTIHHLPLQPLPFRPLTHRAILTLPPGVHQYRVVRAQSVIASGTLHVLPLQLPSTVSHPIPSTTHNAFARPLPNAVAFTFAENIPRMTAVHLEIGSSNPRSMPMIKRGHTFTKKLPLSPGLHRYRFRVLFQPPLRRVTDIPLSRVGWNFADSFRWGVATQWMTVQVAAHPPASPSPNTCMPTNHAIENAADLHNTPLTTTTAAPGDQLETLQCATSCDDESSSDMSDAPLRIDTMLDGYSSEVSDDIHHFAIFSSTSDESTTNSSLSVPQSLSNDPPPQPYFSSTNIASSSDASSSDASSSDASSSDASSCDVRIHEHSSSTTSRASTRDLPTACAAFVTTLAEKNSKESVIDALRITPDVSDAIWFAEITSLPANMTLRDTGNSPRVSCDIWRFATKNAENMEKLGTQSWTKGIAMVSLKAALKGAMMAVADSMMSRTKAKPD